MESLGDQQTELNEVNAHLHTTTKVSCVIMLNPCIRSRRWRQQKQTHKPKERW